MLQRKRKLKSIRDPASREVRSEFDQPRPRLTFVQQSTNRIRCIDLDQGSGRIPAVPTTSVEAAKKTDISKTGRGKH